MTEEINKTGYTYDLKDIDTKEVSLVDRAANKRKFLIVKNFGGAGMKTDIELGLEEIKAGIIPPPVLEAVIKMTQSAIEKLISVASKLEGIQEKGKSNTDTEKANDKVNPMPAEFTKEFKNIISILESILQKYPSATQKKEDAAVSPEKNSETVLAEAKLKELNSTFDNLSKKLDDLKVIVDKFSVKEIKEMDNSDKDKDVKKAELKAEDKKPGDDKKVEVVPAAINKAEILSEMKKMLDDRGTELVKLFKEAAAEEFKPLFDRVSAIETTLGGNKKPDSSDTPAKEYERTYGMQESDPKVTEEENPFTSMFKTIA
jgi:hypothetical protein